MVATIFWENNWKNYVLRNLYKINMVSLDETNILFYSVQWAFIKRHFAFIFGSTLALVIT